jgi:hypothetical protein
VGDGVGDGENEDESLERNKNCVSNLIDLYYLEIIIIYNKTFKCVESSHP